jgi:hypothetical protein
LMHCHMNPLRRRPFFTLCKTATLHCFHCKQEWSSCVCTFRKRMVLVFRHRSSIQFGSQVSMQNWIYPCPRTEESMSNRDGSGGGYKSKRQAGHASPLLRTREVTGASKIILLILISQGAPRFCRKRERM